MEVCMDDGGCVAPSQSTTNVLAVGQASYQRAQEPEALGMDITPMSASEVMEDDEIKSLQIPHHANTRCPSASSSRPDRRGGVSYVLQPDGNRRLIELGAGTTVVGRSKEYGIQDCHVSRRHVEVTVPEKGADGSDAGWCLIKNIGRNCRAVVVNGIFLKAEQEVIAGRGTKIILNANDKDLPQYTYTLVPTANFQPLVTRRPTCSRGGAFRRPKLRRPLWDSLFVLERKRAQAHARFRKEKQEKLQREREEILKTFADLHVA